MYCPSSAALSAVNYSILTVFFCTFPLHLPTGMQYGYVANSGASSASATTSGPAAAPSSSSSDDDDDDEEEEEDEEAGLLELFPPHNQSP